MNLLAGQLDFFSFEAALPALKWTVIVVLLVVGFLGTFLPILPGTTLILAGVVFHYFALGMEDSGLTWQGLAFITVLYILSLLIDWFSGAVGARWFGSSKWGIVGAILGGIVGLFFSLPGLIIGPIVGVFLFEIFFAKKVVKDASNSTIGTVVGGLAGLLGKVIVAFGMIVWYVADVFAIN
ncbi:MAG: DUF456 domain-containing protein [Verrucomicrobiales bacterium]